MKWRRLDSDPNDIRIHLTCPQRCAFARDYYRRQGFNGEANQLIVNLKMGVDAPQSRLKYRTSAIKQFASELTSAIPDGSTVAPVPPTIRPDGSKPDTRIHEVLMELKRMPSHQSTSVVDVVGWKRPKQRAHEGGPRSPEELIPLLTWLAKDVRPPEFLYVCDDMITSGGTFEAVRNVVGQFWPQTVVFGVFWTRAVEE